MTTELSVEVKDWVQQWLRFDPDDSTRKEILELQAQGDEAELRKRLQTRIAFGTAGLRARMGAGFAYMNTLTVTQASQGLCMYLLDQFGEEQAKERGIVIGFDKRYNSERFARLAASIFISKGVKVYLYSEIVATPILSFGVRHLNCVAGVMVTASHNPKLDNGYKVFWDNSAQIIPPHDAGISSSIESNLQVWPGVVEQSDNIRENALCFDFLEDVCDAYYKLITSQLCRKKDQNSQSDLKVVFTAMHGVGKNYVARAFECFGLPPYIPVVEQIDPDPEFSTVKFPNPEEKGALDLSVETATKFGAQLILANDPDSDRLAMAVPEPDGGWRILTGNEIAVLFADYCWRCWKEDNPDKENGKAVMASSTVSSKILQGMATKEGFLFEDTLTGFKWMGNLADSFIKRGFDFLFSFEVELGFMPGNACLDKDGVRTAALMNELVLDLHRKGVSVQEHLHDLYSRYGFYYMINKYFFCYKKEDMITVFQRLREGGPDGGYIRQCGAFKVLSIRDATKGMDDSFPDGQSRLPLMPDQMITYTLENASVTLRNSGTEPKLKYYVDARSESGMDEAKALADAIEEALIRDFLVPEQHNLEAP